MQLLDQNVSCSLHPLCAASLGYPVKNKDVGGDSQPPEGKKEV